jgi:NifB/MoaA-like Fe-S oxidoreductase
LDLKDQKYAREEALGIQQLLAGIVANHPRDDDRIERASQLFNDLYRSFSKGA